MSLEQAIAAIVSKIPSNCIFDAHTVINELSTNKKYREIYMEGYSGSIETYHGRIAQAIGNLANCKKQDFYSFSHTIYGKLTGCTCWKKK